MMSPLDQKRLLVQALVGNQDRLYLNSARFHAQIEMLAELLMPMVDGIASHCRYDMDAGWCPVHSLSKPCVACAGRRSLAHIKDELYGG